jgi:hydrogenase maturation protein HypF
LRLSLRGSVQGVGFRPFVWQVAHELGLRGSVRNIRGGVVVDAFGSPAALSSLRDALAAPPLPGARVDDTEARALALPGPAGFEIVASSSEATRDPAVLALAADLPTCEQCLDELADPSSRRHRYPFIACAHCGPRYAMARGLPYDRRRTAMADFPLCAACASEYQRPSDRRFHAEATSCPDCGPTLQCVSPSGDETLFGESALAEAVAFLRRGGVVGVRGLGGFHLACDASDDGAVKMLRERKQRDRKPLAVMVASLAEAEALAWLKPQERALLASEARPITLTRQRESAALASSVAPGSPLVGLLLAYTPLHTLLLEDFGGSLVMTSANRSGEPIAYRRGETADLDGLADVILSHDREITTPCDDSVAMAAPSGPIVLRRSRGYVPRPIRLRDPLRRGVLACGGHWNNTVCVARGEHAWLSAHIGDIDAPSSVERMEEAALRLLEQLGIEPEIVAHDLHPGYESTRFARAWPGAAPRIGVQHHHAHMAAVLAEHGADGPALGLIWDGTGYGGDGSAWGGELLHVEPGALGEMRRLGTFRPLPLAGGERAIREPWRLALALLEDAFDGRAPASTLALFQRVDPRAREQVSSLLGSASLCPPSHGVGRYFDAVGALVLARPSASFQGELAIGLNVLCMRDDAPPYAFDLDRSQRPWQLDLRPAVRELVRDLHWGVAPEAIAERFHATLITAGAALVREAVDAASELDLTPGAPAPIVALGGGCFQNPILLSGLELRLAGDFTVVRPRQLPPGDGGLALGQALIADALAGSTPEVASPSPHQRGRS